MDFFADKMTFGYYSIKFKTNVISTCTDNFETAFFPTDTMLSAKIKLSTNKFETYLLNNIKGTFINDGNVAFKTKESCQEAIDWFISQLLINTMLE